MTPTGCDPDSAGNEVLLEGGFLYFATDDAVFRYPFPEGSTTPAGPPDTLVSGLPNESNHRAKSLALDPGGSLFVNIGSPPGFGTQWPDGSLFISDSQVGKVWKVINTCS